MGVSVMGANKGGGQGGGEEGAEQEGGTALPFLWASPACAAPLPVTPEEYGAPALLTSRQHPCLGARLRSDLGPDLG